MQLFGFNTTKKQEVTQSQPIVNDYEKFWATQTSPRNLLNYDYNNPLVTEVYNSDYVYFGDDNIYPNILNELFYSSPFHSSIINFKVLNVIGGGYDVIPDIGIDMQAMISIKQMEMIFNESFLNQMAYDFNIHNRLTWKIYWNNDHSKIIKIERIDPAWVRATKKDSEGNIKKYAIGEDWTGRIRNKINQYYYLPTFDVYAKDEKVQLYTWKGFSPGMEYYAKPIYANANNWLYLDGQISYYHKSNIENSINPSVVMKFYETFANKQEQNDFVYNLKKSFTGAKNSGKVLTFFSNGKELAPDIESIQANQLDEAFAVTQEMIVKNIAFAHTIDPVLLGISTPGALGTSQQLEVAYNIFRNTYINPTQFKLDTIINYFLGINKIQATFKLRQFNLI